MGIVPAIESPRPGQKNLVHLYENFVQRGTCVANSTGINMYRVNETRHRNICGCGRIDLNAAFGGLFLEGAKKLDFKWVRPTHNRPTYQGPLSRG